MLESWLNWNVVLHLFPLARASPSAGERRPASKTLEDQPWYHRNMDRKVGVGVGGQEQGIACVV